MKAWRLDRIIGAVEYLRRQDPKNRFGREYCLSFKALSEETGIERSGLFRLHRNERSRTDLSLLEILLSWGSDALGRELTVADLIEVMPEPWSGPTSLKEWEKLHPLKPHEMTTGGRETQRAVSERRIKEAKAYFRLK